MARYKYDPDMYPNPVPFVEGYEGWEQVDDGFGGKKWVLKGGRTTNWGGGSNKIKFGKKFGAGREGRKRPPKTPGTKPPGGGE